MQAVVWIWSLIEKLTKYETNGPNKICCYSPTCCVGIIIHRVIYYARSLG